jgi:disulfide bond formation protein DsbB
MMIAERHISDTIATGTRARVLTLGVLIASLAALAFAFVAEYGFGARPCILCLYGRLPYAVTAVIAAAALLLLTRDSHRHAAVWLLCATVFLAGTALSAYHVGVQQHWWRSVAGCTADPLAPLTVDDLRATMTGKPPLAACDEVSVRVFGLSLAAWNGMYALALAMACIIGASVNGRFRR